MRSTRIAAAVLAMAALATLGACRNDATTSATTDAAPVRRSTATDVAATPPGTHTAQTAVPPPPGSTAPGSTPAGSAPVGATPPSTGAPRGITLADDIDAAQGATQVLVVTNPAGDLRTTTPVLRAFEQSPQGWRQVFGDIPARIGSNGFGVGHDKHEGDNRTPVGVYGLPLLFGGQLDPGGHPGIPYRVIQPGDCWAGIGDPANYNTWVHKGVCNQAAKDEDLFHYASDAYRFAALIDFNAARTLGDGSAIFLHVFTGGPTAGCVAIPEDQLVAILQWLRPGALIAMGPEDLVRAM